MVDELIKNKRKNNATPYLFTVLIPTWNNLPYLQVCVESIWKNTYSNIQIILIINEGKDGTIEWAMTKKEDLDFIISPKNLGICYGLNAARSLIQSDYVLYANDDMYFLPDWDKALYEEIQALNTKMFMLSATMIEHTDTGNPAVIVRDYGKDLASFDENALLNEYKKYCIPDWQGSTWPPNIVHIDIWDLVGGLSIEYSPGMYSDPDFSMKLYELGVRIFKGKGNSLVYHFGAKSTKRIKKNKGREMFLLKWGITANTFMNTYLKIGQTFTGEINPLKPTTYARLITIFKKIKAVCKINP